MLEEHATAGIEHTFNRLTLKLTGIVADYDYSDTTDPGLTGPVPFADIRDYREVVGTLRSTYEFQPSWAGFIETSINERDYREPINVAGIRRGSSGFTAMAGVNLRLAGTLFGEIAAGWGSSSRSTTVSRRSQARFSMAI
ncbi:MAG: outer membrane beta-barrel protein [Methyloceanibacter sp.]|nr:outer membrane beta-barrel protein [Methyloceanibacter sp.]